MLLRTTVVDNTNSELVEKIKKEIVSTLQRKGVKISQVNLDLNSGNLNISVSINSK